MSNTKIQRARNLRKNMTDAEKKIWLKLRNRQIENLKFRRQYPCGPYYLDFYCPEKKFAIELDGGQHYTKKQRLKDRKRDKYLRERGITVLRYSDRDVFLNFEGVLKDILNRIITSSPFPSPQRGEGTKKRFSPQRGEGTKKRFSPQRGEGTKKRFSPQRGEGKKKRLLREERSLLPQGGERKDENLATFLSLFKGEDKGEGCAC